MVESQEGDGISRFEAVNRASNRAISGHISTLSWFRHRSQRPKVLILLNRYLIVYMSQPTGSADKEYTTLVVSPQFRDKIRVAKAEDGLSYEEYLRQHLPIGAE